MKLDGAKVGRIDCQGSGASAMRRYEGQALRTFLVLCRAHSGSSGFSPAHISTMFGLAVPARAGEMVHVRIQVSPYDRLSWTMRFGLQFRTELPCRSQDPTRPFCWRGF